MDARPTWPSRTTAISTPASSTAVDWVGCERAKRSISERSLSAWASASLPAGTAASARSASSDGGAHATPISTPRKRAGAEPCETRATWPGSPLPQLTTEASRHSEAEQTASIEPQNCGVTPA